MVVRLTDEYIYDDDDVLLEIGDAAILASELLEKVQYLFVDGPVVEMAENLERRLQLELQQAQLDRYLEDPEDFDDTSFYRDE